MEEWSKAEEELVGVMEEELVGVMEEELAGVMEEVEEGVMEEVEEKIEVVELLAVLAAHNSAVQHSARPNRIFITKCQLF